MSAPITIHAIFSAHLDPIWMWPWTSGLDEAVATARSACDRLDAHPDIFYTQGEAWTLDMVRRVDPELFGRIRRHVEAGRWEVANGWWCQPDCNFPTEEGLRRQIGTGLAWVRRHLAVQPRCGFNPDSFGHCAKLPDILRDFGQDRYVFMRPMPPEMRLPKRLFTWRSRPGGPAVTTFRIADSYSNGMDVNISTWPIQNALRELPPGCRHTLSFFGVGNHGGGPTERLVAWVRENADSIPGARIEFSTLGRFFDAVERDATPLPEVHGELQFHAIGCYSVVRSVKSALRRAEHALARAETVAQEEERPRLEQAWQAVASHQFHDTLGGSSVPDAYRFAEDQLGGAAATAEEILAYGIRRNLVRLPADSLPRLVLANPGAHVLEDWTEATFYMEGEWLRPWRLLDEAGKEVPFQRVPSGAGVYEGWFWGLRRVLVRTRIPAGGTVILRPDLSQPPTAPAPEVEVSDRGIANAALAVGFGPWYPCLTDRGSSRDVPLRLQIIGDPTDTWSHRVDRYAEAPLAEAQWQPPVVQDRGGLMASMVQNGTIGSSRLKAEWRVYAGEPWAELLLDVHWCEQHRILKLVVPAGGAATRVDGTPGMALERVNEGREVPVHDWTRLAGLAVVSPDVFAMDATPERARLTLLRSPLMAHHDPEGPFARSVVADQGPHRFRFRFWLGETPVERLAAAALSLNRPALVAEWTAGMPARWTEYRGAHTIA